MMRVASRALVTLWDGRFQEAEGVAQGPRPFTEHRSPLQKSPPSTIRVIPQSDLSSRTLDPANIAEGRRKTSEKEFARFLGIAVSSSSELESHLIFARDAKIITENDFVSLVSETIEIRKMLYALIKRLSGP